MKNKVVTQNIPYYYYSVKDSTIGKSRNRLHPYINNNTIITNTPHFLKVGDILRCDGLPFLSRPRPIKTLKDKIGTSRRIEIVTHRPIKLPSGFWVLRPV